MGKSTPKPPPAPDPVAIANAQTKSNLNTAIAQTALNNTNINSPYGSQTFTQTGSTNVNGIAIPQYTQNITLSPAEQAKLDATNAIQQQALGVGSDQLNAVSNSLSKPVDFSGAPSQVTSVSGGPIKTSVPGQTLETNLDAPGQLKTSVPGQTYNTYVPGQTYQNSFGDGGDIQKQIDMSGIPNIPGIDDFSADRARVEEALMSRLNPQFQKDQADLENQLITQGFTRGTQAFQDQLDVLNRAKNDARFQAVLAGGQEQSRLFGLGMGARQQMFNEAMNKGGFANSAQAQAYGQALGRGQFYNDSIGNQFGMDMSRANFENAAKGAQFNTDLTAANFENQSVAQKLQQDIARMNAVNAAKSGQQSMDTSAASFSNAAQAQDFMQQQQNAALNNTGRQQYIQEMLTERNQPLNELAALLGTSGGVNMPTFTAPSQTAIAPTNTMAAEQMKQDALNQAYQAKLAQSQSAMGGMFDLAGGIGSALIMSDERTKENKRRVGRTNEGLPIYTFNYKSGGPTQMGVMAQDVEKKVPNAVFGIGGVKHVDYGKVA